MFFLTAHQIRTKQANLFAPPTRPLQKLPSKLHQKNKNKLYQDHYRSPFAVLHIQSFSQINNWKAQQSLEQIKIFWGKKKPIQFVIFF